MPHICLKAHTPFQSWCIKLWSAGISGFATIYICKRALYNSANEPYVRHKRTLYTCIHTRTHTHTHTHTRKLTHTHRWCHAHYCHRTTHQLFCSTATGLHTSYSVHNAHYIPAHCHRITHQLFCTEQNSWWQNNWCACEYTGDGVQQQMLVQGGVES